MTQDVELVKYYLIMISQLGGELALKKSVSLPNYQLCQGFRRWNFASASSGSFIGPWQLSSQEECQQCFQTAAGQIQRLYFLSYL